MVARLTSRSEASACDQPVACDLCELTTTFPLYDDAGRAFCCPACREVSGLLTAEQPIESAVCEVPIVENCDTATLELAGMWCPSCSWLISETLERARGVIEADVNFLQRETSHVQIVYEPPRGQATQLHL